MSTSFAVDLVLRSQGGRQLRDFTNKLQGVERSSDKAQRGLDDVGRSAKGAQQSVQRLSGAMSGLITSLAGGVAIQKIARDFADLDTSLRRLGTVGGDVKGLDAGLGKLSRNLEGIASKAELAKASYQALSAGFSDTASNLKVVEAATKASVGGLEDVTGITEVVTKTLNAYNMSGNDAVKVTDSISKAIEYGQVQWSDYTSQLGRVASIAAVAGVSLDEVNAFIAASTKNGATAEIAFTGLGGALNTLLQPTKESEEAAQKLGIQWNLAGLKSKGFSALMGELAVAMETDQAAAVKLLGSQEAMRGVFSANAKAGKDYKAILEGLGGAAGKTQSDFDKMKGSLENQLKALDTAFKNLGEALAKAFGPEVIEVVKDLTAVINAFAGMINAIPRPVAAVVSKVVILIAKMLLLQKALKGMVALRGAVTAMLASTATGITATGTAARVANPFLLKTKALMSSLAKFGIITLGVEIIVNGLEKLAEVEARFSSIAGSSTKSFAESIGGSALSKSEIDKLIKENRAEYKRRKRELDSVKFPGLTAQDDIAKAAMLQLDTRLAQLQTMRGRAAYANPAERDKADSDRLLAGLDLDDKDKKEKKKEKELYDFTSKNQAALAQNEIALNRQVFDNEMGLLRQRYELEQTYIEKLAGLRGAGLSPGGRGIFGEISQFNSQQKAYEAQRRQLEEEVKTAEQAVKAAKAGVAVAGLQGMSNRVASAGGVGVPSGSAAERLLSTANKNLGLFAGQSERCADAMRELYKQTGIGIGVTKKAWDGLASGGSLASSFFGSDIGQKITNIRDLRPGDLVGFERTYGNWGPGVQTHVGMYAGGGMMYDHSSKRGLVKRPLDTFAGKFMYGVRPTALGGIAGATSGGQQIAPGGQADMTGLLGAQGDVATAEAQLNGANERLKQFNAEAEKLKALDFPTLLATMSQSWADQTTQLQNQTAALQLRSRLEQEGVDPALIEGELRKLEISQQLSQQIEGLDAALKLYNDTQGKAGISSEQHAEALKTLKERATGAATEVERLAQATKAANDPINKLVSQWSKELNDTRGQVASLAQTIEGEIGSAMSNAITGLIDGTQTAEEAFSQMFKNIGAAFIDMATQMIAKALVMKALGILSGGAGAGAGGVASAFIPTGGWDKFGSITFAGGGYTGDGPRIGGVDGEGGFPAILHPGETVVDHRQGNSGMHEAMRRYRAGNNAGGAGGGGAAGEGGGASPITLNVTATRIADENWVKVDDMNAALAQTRSQAAKDGAAAGYSKTMQALKNSRSQRGRLGL